jgi:hypothetical protein
MAKQTANRENAKRSTGPKTEMGKAASRLNAIQHGLTADTPLLPGEDAQARAALFTGLREDLAPEGSLEHELVSQIASVIWRLRRIERVEAALYAYRMLQDCRADGLETVKPMFLHPADLPGAYYRPEEERIEASFLASKSQSDMEDPRVSIGRAFLRDVITGDWFGHLSRYETSHIRNLQRLHNELRACQAARQND